MSPSPRPARGNTLALRATPDLVGDACIYLREFDTDTRNAWWALERQVRGRGPERVPYTIATTALRVLTGGYVHLDDSFAFLASREPITDRLLERMFTYLEGLALGTPIDDIRINQPPQLAQLASRTPQQSRHLADYLTTRPSAQPVLPNWVYQTVRWDLARQIAAHPFTLYELEPLKRPDKNGKMRTYAWEPGETRQIEYLPDGSGALIGWHAPFGRLFNSTDIDPGQVTARDAQYALSRLSLALKTMPNITSPVLMLDSHVTRIYSNLVYAKTALVEQPKPGLPILRIDLVGGGGMRTVNRLSLQILAQLRMDDTPLREIEQRSATESNIVKATKASNTKPNFITPKPGHVRPLMPKNYPFAIGTGPGMLHLRLLAEHLEQVFGDRASHLDLGHVPMSFTNRPTDSLKTKEKERRLRDGLPIDTSGLPTPGDVHRSLAAGEFHQLRLVCLYYRPETRLRMINCLANAYDLDAHQLDPPEGQPVALTPQVSAVFHTAEVFLAHGGADGRRATTRSFQTHLHTDGPVLLAAFCETEIPAKPERKPGESTESLTRRMEHIDAKHQTRQLLAADGVSTQYLLGRERDKFNLPGQVIQPTDTDHPATMALCDLYRQLGIIDQRIEQAIYPPGDQYALPRMAFCGIHVRKQASTNGRKDEPRRIILATALAPPPHPGGVWTMLGWTSLDRAWQPYHQASLTFHSNSYPQHRRGTGADEQQRWAEAGRDIDQALADLSEELEGLPYTVMIDGAACRRIWPGLQNQNLGRAPDPAEQRTWMPGATLLPEQRPAAAVRINTQHGEVPQPWSITQVHKDGTTSEDRTSEKLYRLTPDFGDPSWILFNIPRNYDGKGGGRLGSTRTRWDAPIGRGGDETADRLKNELKAPWYTMTSTEIHPVVNTKGLDREALAVATARLCHQTIAWSDRARYPVPLHAAKQIDLDHPEYRRSAPPQDRPTLVVDDEYEDE